MFYRRTGNVVTTQEYIRPTKNVFLQWATEWLETYKVNYKVTFFGCSAEIFYGKCTLDTWDIDIMLEGEIEDYKYLNLLLTEAVKIGNKYRLKIDIFHVNKPYTSTEWEPYEQIRFYKDVFTISNRKVHTIDHTKFADIEELPHTLYKYKRKKKGGGSYEKFKKRLKHGYYSDIRLNLKELINESY
jgi:hypothetical protein|tara:strand:- start:786 stop:1343 length:558 start_codon:yes stop_codon:yes gene_type:complete